jgi:hypothetical protein
MSVIQSNSGSLARVIQLSVAPVFLLTGIFAFLGVLSQRVARTFDHLMRMINDDTENGDPQIVKLQKRRFVLVNRAFVAAVIAAILICVVVIVLFISDVTPLNLSVTVIPAFVIAMLCLVRAMLYFLTELRLGMRVARLRLPGCGL